MRSVSALVTNPRFMLSSDRNAEVALSERDGTVPGSGALARPAAGVMGGKVAGGGSEVPSVDCPGSGTLGGGVEVPGLG